MPELPEVEIASVRLRRAAEGRRIVSTRIRHPALRRQLTRSSQARLRGARIDRVERRGKYQLLHLDTGHTLIAHFRMTGDWHIRGHEEPPPRFARAEIVLDNGTHVVLDDPRALSSLQVAPSDALALPRLGPDPLTRSFSARALGVALARRRGPIKPALLDQAIAAGVGNIYASEALWRARVHPAAPAAALQADQLRDITRSIRAVLREALRRASRYSGADGDTERFAVYDRRGEPCRRCGTAIERIAQAARSTYYCPNCQQIGVREAASLARRTR
jgi:formamidopyrimidine-DNA glycosylase